MIGKHLKIFRSGKNDIVFWFEESWFVFYLPRNGQLESIVITVRHHKFRPAYFFFNCIGKRSLYATRMTFVILAFHITHYAEYLVVIFFKAIKAIVILYNQENDQRCADPNCETQ